MKYIKKLEIVEAVEYEIGLEDGFMEMYHDADDPTIVWRVQGDGEIAVDIPYIFIDGRNEPIGKDDYIVTDGDGDRTCVPAEVFESMYDEWI